MTYSERIAEITPQPRASSCEVSDCDARELLAAVSPDCRSENRVLCPEHRIQYLREVYIK